MNKVIKSGNEHTINYYNCEQFEFSAVMTGVDKKYTYTPYFKINNKNGKIINNGFLNKKGNK
jgi:hypothetical protein